MILTYYTMLLYLTYVLSINYELRKDLNALEQRYGLNLLSGTRIVNGEIAEDAEQYHFMMAIFAAIVPEDLTLICGGTLINEYTVVTASHCNRSFSFHTFKAYQHIYDFDNKEHLARGTRFNIIDFIQHPKYDPKLYINDIAVLRLDKPAKVKATIQLDDTTIANDFLHKVRVIGWGLYGAGPFEYSRILRRADLQIADSKVCQLYMKSLFEDFIDGDKHICALKIGGQADSCQGDSGGPLLAKVCGKWVLVGIVSFGRKCGMATAPGIYTKVGNYVDWIRHNTFFK